MSEKESDLLQGGGEVIRGDPVESPQALAEVARFREMVRGPEDPQPLSLEGMIKSYEEDRATREADVFPLQRLLDEAQQEERIFGSDSPRAQALKRVVEKRRASLLY